MALDPWLPIGYRLPSGAAAYRPLFEGPHWQIIANDTGGRTLLVEEVLFERWVNEFHLTDGGHFSSLVFNERALLALDSAADQTVAPVAECRSPRTKDEALAFALALSATRSIGQSVPLQDALYVEKISRLLPTFSISSPVEDDVVLGYWLTGGATTSAKSFRRLAQMMSWIPAAALKEIVEAAGITIDTAVVPEKGAREPQRTRTVPSNPEAPSAEGNVREMFQLAGRPDLEAFIREHVIDIISNRARYGALGIHFPAGIVLHGPPGCGKSFAVEKLVEFLGWPSFQIDASSVASPYIHETSRKVAALFEAAMENSPSVLIIDEMEAFLADRDAGSGHHHVEEVAEFLRRIPEASKNEVLVLAMTNRIDMVDPAILRRGRFDHVIRVPLAGEKEVLSLLLELLRGLPVDNDVDATEVAKQLANRPLSDVAFVVREGARLAARASHSKIDQNSLMRALQSTPSRAETSPRRIGFV